MQELGVSSCIFIVKPEFYSFFFEKECFYVNYFEIKILNIMRFKDC